MTEPTTTAGRYLVRRIWDGWHPSRSEQNEAEFAAIVLAIEEQARAEGRREADALLQQVGEALVAVHTASDEDDVPFVDLMERDLFGIVTEAVAAYSSRDVARHGRSSDPEPAPPLDRDALRQALATVYHWAMPEDEEDDAEEILHVNQIAAEYDRIRGAAPALQATGEPPHE